MRSFCPFCGTSNEPSSLIPCCDQWLETADTTVETRFPPVRVEIPVRVESPPGAETFLRVGMPLHVEHRRGLPPIRRPPKRVSQPVATLIASAITAVVVSLGSQSMGSITQALGIRAASPVIGQDAAALAVESRQPPTEISRSTTPPATNHAPSAAENRPVSMEWTPEFRTKWSQLNRMMSRTSVRALLGDPKWIDRASSPRLEYWLYKDPTIRGEGWIAFIEDRPWVYNWWTSDRLQLASVGERSANSLER
jgi:hypothetical protein